MINCYTEVWPKASYVVVLPSICAVSCSNKPKRPCGGKMSEAKLLKPHLYMALDNEIVIVMLPYLSRANMRTIYYEQSECHKLSAIYADRFVQCV